MKRFISLLILLFCISFALTGCKGSKEASQAEKASADTKTEEEAETTKIEELSLTEKEVKSFIEAYPVFMKIAKEVNEEFKGLSDSKSLLKGIKAGKEYEEKVNRALKEYGFTMEGFIATYGKIMGTFFYMKSAEFREKTRENMKEMLKNPAIPEEQKKEIKENLEEMEEEEESDEIKGYKKNWEIVKKYQDKIEELTSGD